MKKIYLFRHGETEWNINPQLPYSLENYDVELNESGKKQALRNAELLKNSCIQHIYASPLKRAYKTGEILANLINVNIEICDDLREMNGGRYEGMLSKDYKKDFGEENYEIFYHTRNEGMDLSLPGGESKAEIRDRIVGAVSKISKTTPYETIEIASHGFVLREFLRGLDFEDDSPIRNCEVIELEFDDDHLKVIRRICSEN